MLEGVEGTGVEGAAEEMISVEMEGTGGGDIGTLSLLLNSLMNPLFFLAMVFDGAPFPLANEELLGSVGVLCMSTTDEDAGFFAFAGPPLLAERILVQLMADWVLPGSSVRVACVDVAPVAPPVAVALRDRSRACACASSSEMSLIGMGFGL